MHRVLFTLLAVAVAGGSSLLVPAQAATGCSVSAKKPTSNGTVVSAKSTASCPSATSGWLKSSLIYVRNVVPDQLVASTQTTTSRRTSWSATARGCADNGTTLGYKTVAATSWGGAASSAKVDLYC